MSQSELDAIDAVVREVLINLQNSSGDTLTLNNFALTAGQWREALSPHLDVRVEPLGDVEHLVVATRR